MSPTLYRTIYIAGSRLRGTPVMPRLRALLESQWLPAESMRLLQLERLNSLLEHAASRSPFYRRIFGEHGLDLPIDSISDLEKLPAVDKRAMRRNEAEIRNGGRGGRLIKSSTSGTSGEPLEFYRDAGWDAGHRAAIARGYSWYGVDPWSRRGLLWGIRRGIGGRVASRAGDILQNRFRGKRFDLSEDTLEDFRRRLAGAELLEGYSSMIYELARHIDRRGEGRIPLKLVKGTSEKIFPHYHEESRKAFGRPVTSEYGAAETGIIAFECPEGSMHVNMDHVIVEEAEGEIIVTNLISYSFPFIRYRLGDSVKIDFEASCPCGRETPVIREITGRIGGKIVGISGKEYPSLVIYYIIKALHAEGRGIVRMQAAQREAGALEFLAVLEGGLPPGELEKIFDELVEEYFGDDIDARLIGVDSIPPSGGKRVDFVPLIELPGSGRQS